MSRLDGWWVNPVSHSRKKTARRAFQLYIRHFHFNKISILLTKFCLFYVNFDINLEISTLFFEVKTSEGKTFCLHFFSLLVA